MLAALGFTKREHHHHEPNPAWPSLSAVAHSQRHLSHAYAWDAGSALMLASLGFPAIATTSAGVSFSRGFPDQEAAVCRETMLDRVGSIAAATQHRSCSSPSERVPWNIGVENSRVGV
ncbi:isocitrate lyase/phosphoenolpyruvate mutase family protein [Vreelandella olivaria]|uniref:isocitrate lyase/phosphoenolpyruvate mutase family protein n=1 Tax=Vreelandella olivaria TaxID=390919 RepID=UPI003CC90A72